MTEGDQIIFVGDFNLPQINWEWINNDFIPKTMDVTCAAILDAFYGFGTNQCNTVFNSTGRLLDLVFSSDDSISVFACDDLAGHSSIYHTPLLIEVNFFDFIDDSYKHSNFILDFKRGDYIALNKYLNSIDWIETIKGDNVVDSLDKFDAVLSRGVENFIPKKKCDKKPFEPWFNARLSDLSIKRDKAHKLFKRTRDPVHYERFRVLRTEFKHLNHFLYSNYILKIETEIKCNPKRFYSFIDSKKHCVGFPSSMSYNNEILNNQIEVCKGFQMFFSSVYCSDQSNSLNVSDVNLFSNDNILISQDEVFAGLCNLDGNKGAGPDGISPLLLKNCAISLCLPLTLIFNFSLQSGIFPDCWKLSFIRPIFKSGNRSHISNYRGVAILSAIPKFFESLVKNIIQFKVNNLISNAQHGFMSNRSTVTNLLVFTNFVSNCLQKSNQVDVIYTDFSKAFDKISHSLLIEKLKSIDSEVLPIKWLMSYLTNRKQFVRINGHDSEMFDVSSGVPQGSHLGPLLFILFINDVSQCFRFARFLMYADDLKIFLPVINSNDASLLQEDIKRFCDWTLENKLMLNVNKCKVMSFFKKNIRVSFDYTIYDSVIDRVTYFRDLGVIFSFNLSFNRHIDAVISKANSMMGFIKRNARDFHDPYTLKTLYISFVRSNLEYASIVWTPFYSVHIDRIESVQKQFLIFCLRQLPSQRINGMFALESYSSRLRLIDLQSLSIRRTIACCLFVRDVLCSRINCSELLCMYGINAPIRQGRMRNLSLYLPFCRTNSELAEPVYNSIRQFNNVVSVFDFMLSRESFKRNVIAFLNN